MTVPHRPVPHLPTHPLPPSRARWRPAPPPKRVRREGAAPLALAFALASAGFAYSACMTARSDPQSAAEHRARAAEERAAAEAARDPAAAEAANPPPGARFDRTLSGGAVAGPDPGAEAGAGQGHVPGMSVTGVGGAPTLAPPGNAAAHEARARRHEDAAARLERAEDDACAGVAPKQRAACPIFDIAGVVDTASGVRVTFASEGEAIRAAQIIRCQQAFAHTRGYEDVPACALYARGLTMMQHGATLELTAERDEDITRLRENVRGHRPAAK
jgi:hypothetical protein